MKTGRCKFAVPAFTLIELIMVVVILAVISFLAITRYWHSVYQMRERDAVNQLRAIHTANELYYQKSNPSVYLPGTYDMDGINTHLGLSIFANGITYSYTRINATSYRATAATPDNFTVRVDQRVLGDTNPCCSTAGKCPTLPDCP